MGRNPVTPKDFVIVIAMIFVDLLVLIFVEHFFMCVVRFQKQGFPAIVIIAHEFETGASDVLDEVNLEVGVGIVTWWQRTRTRPPHLRA